jgi:hypothetical protein
MSNILTHDRIKLNSGVLASAKGLLFGGNALQSITIGRHSPVQPQQAVGFLGIVDYTSGVITSDAQLDCVIVEGTTKADTATKTNSIYRFAKHQVNTGSESYCLTSSGVTFAANAPATINLGYLTAGLATYLDSQDQPTPGTGEESSFCVVMADDGSGVALVPTWYSTTPLVTNNLPILDASGTLTNASDQGLPAGIQTVSLSAGINRDQIVDVRAVSPVQWVTTYPLDLRADMEVHMLPVLSGVNRPGDVGYDPTTFKHQMRNLKDLAIQATNLGKHVAGGATAASNNDVYVKAIGFKQTDESEGVSVGRYLTYRFNFIIADLLLPLADPG